MLRKGAWPCIGAFHALRYERAIKAQVEKDRPARRILSLRMGTSAECFGCALSLNFWVRALLDGKKHRG